MHTFRLVQKVDAYPDQIRLRFCAYLRWYIICQLRLSGERCIFAPKSCHGTGRAPTISSPLEATRERDAPEDPLRLFGGDRSHWHSGGRILEGSPGRGGPTRRAVI